MILGEVDFINYLGHNGLTISRAIPSRADFHRGNFFLHEGGVWLFDLDS